MLRRSRVPSDTAAPLKSARSCIGGRSREDFPRLLALYRNKRLKLDELITRTYTIDEAPQAFADLTAGKNARGVIVFG